MKARKGRTLFFVDIAVPRNVEPGVHGIDNVYAFNVDDLEKEVARGFEGAPRRDGGGRSDRRAGGDAVPRMARGLEVQPTVVAMRAKARAVLFTELERLARGRLKHLPREIARRSRRCWRAR